MPKTVGVKRLKAKLSEYLRLVKGGETILVTERDEVVAELRPARRQPGVPDDLDGLLDERQAGRDRDAGPADSSLDFGRRAGLEDSAEDGRGVEGESRRHYGESRSARTSPRRRCAVAGGRPSP
jgi:antitoxin (DNA-binding transcriptional repressor) of toxin-antitoxin stability system